MSTKYITTCINKMKHYLLQLKHIYTSMREWELTGAVKCISDESSRTEAAVVTWKVCANSVLAAVSVVQSTFVNICNLQ